MFNPSRTPTKTYLTLSVLRAMAVAGNFWLGSPWPLFTTFDTRERHGGLKSTRRRMLRWKDYCMMNLLEKHPQFFRIVPRSCQTVLHNGSDLPFYHFIIAYILFIETIHYSRVIATAETHEEQLNDSNDLHRNSAVSDVSSLPCVECAGFHHEI